jgi:hypothetical protein
MLTDPWPVTAKLDDLTGVPDIQYTSDEHAAILAGLIVRDVNGAPRAGVLPRHTGTLVSARPDMKVNIAPFEAVLVNAGIRMLALTEQITLDVTAAQQANTRYDIVYVEATDRALTNVKSTSAVKIATGQPNSIPQDPAVPAGAARLARLTITANATATNSGVTITPIHQFTCTTGGVLLFRTTTEMGAWEGTPWQRATVIASGAGYVRDGSSWVVDSADSGIDGAGWSYTSLAGGKRQYTRYFPEWSGADFGPVGGTNWSQARAGGIAPPTGKTWDQFIVDVSTWPKTTNNGLQFLLQGVLNQSSGTTPASLNIVNPTTLAIPNLSMDLRSAITLIER